MDAINVERRDGASLLDTLTTKQLDALLVMARYGWHSRPSNIVYDHKALISARECVKPLLFPSEEDTDGQ